MLKLDGLKNSPIVFLAAGGVIGALSLLLNVIFRSPVIPGQIAWLICVYMAVIYAWRLLTDDWYLTLITVAGLSLYFIGIFYISVVSFAYDANSHLQIIQYIASSGDWFGQIDQGDWFASTNHHIKNPFFYICAAAIYAAGQFFNWDIWFAVRQLTLALYLLYLYFALGSIRLAIRSPLLQKVLYAAVAFWPIGFTNPARISPDIAVGACGMGVFYFLMRWQKSHGSSRDLALALVFSGFSILCKSLGFSNIMIICGVVALSACARDFDVKKFLSVPVLLALCFNLFCIGTTFYNPAGLHQRVGYVATHVNFDDIARNAAVYLTFRFDYYLHFLLSDWDLYRPESSFWSGFLASLFIGDPWYMEWKSKICALTVGVLGLFMCITILSVWFHTVFLTRGRTSFDWLPTLAIAVPVAALLIMRVVYVDGTHIGAFANARYIPHVAAIFTLAYGKALEGYWQQERRELFYVGSAVLGVFIVASLLLFTIECGLV